MRTSMEPTTLVDGYRDGQLTRRQFIEGALKLGVSATAAAGLLAACTSKKKAGAPTRLSGRVQILVGFDGGNSTTQRQVQQTLAEAFIAAHPQVGIDFIRATSAPAAQSQLSTLVGRGSAPDIVLGIGLADVSRFADQHAWTDLGPLMHRDGVSTGAFVSEATAAAALSGYYGATKAVPGVPVGIHDHALAYNVELFSEAGLALPPSSWSDSSWTYSGSFLQAAQALTVDQQGRNAGQPGFDARTAIRYGVARISPEVFFFAFGGHWYDSSRRQARFDTSDAVAGAQFAGDLVNRYRVQPTAAGLVTLGGAGPAADPTEAAWRAGRLAMIDMCSCDLTSPFAAQVPFAWKAAALPKGPAGPGGALEVSLGTIVAASRQHDLAWEVLKFFAVDTAREGQLAWGGFGAMPAVRANVSLFPQGITQGVGVPQDVLAVWTSGLPSASAESDSWVPAFATVKSLFSATLAQVVGGTPAATAMPQLQQRAQAAIDAWFHANQLPH
jgi:multiple sugar transport system substrate-binding protein